MAAGSVSRPGMGGPVGGGLSSKELRPEEPLGTLVPGIGLERWGFHSTGNGKFFSRQALFHRNHPTNNVFSVLRQLDRVAGSSADEGFSQCGQIGNNG